MQCGPESVDGPLDELLGELVDGVVSGVGEGQRRQRHREQRVVVVDGPGRPPPHPVEGGGWR